MLVTKLSLIARNLLLIFARSKLLAEARGWCEQRHFDNHRNLASHSGLNNGRAWVDLALAETGTMILRSGPGTPRSTSLLPACHVAVFDRTVLVETLAQVSVFLEAWHTDDAPGAMINFITGPSRTADIELTLTRGVHGPKEVHAIFVEEPIRG